ITDRLNTCSIFPQLFPKVYSLWVKHSGQWLFIAFSSFTLNIAEQYNLLYSSTQHYFSIIYSTKDQYCMPTFYAPPMTIFERNSPFVYIENGKVKESCCLWFLRTSGLDVLLFTPGKDNVVADFLSPPEISTV
ncbi:hypothetical protein QQF64_031570, partial [Cirrhinus molitorella]